MQAIRHWRAGRRHGGRWEGGVWGGRQDWRSGTSLDPEPSVEGILPLYGGFLHAQAKELLQKRLSPLQGCTLTWGKGMQVIV